MQQKLIITPKTKILDLITDYPELEELLFEISPAFKQLRNPVLRRTVARVSTLQQAALVGGIKVEDLINQLRQASGTQNSPNSDVEMHHDAPVHDSSHPNTSPAENPAPDWFSADKVIKHLDAREMLNRGEHPVGQVLTDLHNLPVEEIYELTAPFFPAPLIDKATGIGFNHYVIEENPQLFRIYFSQR